jgi:integrase/recombinase XerD
MAQEEILEPLEFDLELRGYSPHTHVEYLTEVKIFQNYFGKPANELGEPEIKEFLHFWPRKRNLVP